MEKSRYVRLGLRIACAALVCGIAGTASADGLKSKGKGPVPIAPGIVETLTETQRKQGHGAPIVSLPTDDKVVIGIIVRRNERANRRRDRWFGSQTDDAKAKKAEADSPVNRGNRIDRSGLIRRGNQLLPKQCENLHTHDKAVCRYRSQLKQMNRFLIGRI